MAMTSGHAKASIVIGVLEGIIGIALIVLSVVVAGYGNGISTAQSPWWLGALYLVPGICGIVGGAIKNICCMITFLVFNIIVTVINGVIIVFMVLALIFWSAAIEIYKENECTYNDIENKCVCGDWSYSVAQCSYLDTITTALAVTFAILVLCGVLSLTGCILGCMTTCCAPSDPQNVFVVQQAHPGVTVQTTTTHGGFPVQAPPYPPEYEPKGDKVNLVV